MEKQKQNGEIIKPSNKIFKMKKIIVFFTVTLNLFVLFYFKYSNFTLDILQKLFLQCNIELNIPVVDVLLPVGISFYTFQALSYTIDVYRDDVSAEKNFFRYALFVSFFPQLVAGPIERSKNLLTQLAKPHKISWMRLKEGFLLMLWGFFLKIVIADRIAIFVDAVYGDYGTYSGMYLIVATILFAIQIYCDFYGYSTIAVGTSKMLGINLMENFKSPYLAFTVSGFWRNWHISLTSWFKDYLYIPLGGGRKGKVRKYINKMIVFLVSGLWHGAAISFIVWGFLNGLYQVVGELLQPVRDWAVKKLKLSRSNFSHKLLKMLITFILIDFAWIFFRANSFLDALKIIEGIFTTYNPWILFDGSLYECGLNAQNFLILIISILILIIADIAKYYNIKLHQIILKQDDWFKCVFVIVAIITILLFGIYGATYDASNFIYFQF